MVQQALSWRCGDLVALNRWHRDNMAGQLGIVVTAIGPASIRATMPVDQRTRQPLGLLHGGASVALAETLGSVASWLLVSDREGARVAGLEVNASHLTAVREGLVTGVCRPLRIGRTVHFWGIEIFDGQGRRSCVARLTVKVSRAQESPPGKR